MEEKKKSIFMSKTFWFGLITAILPAVSSNAQALITEHTASFGMVWGALSIVLRMVTKEKVILIE